MNTREDVQILIAAACAHGDAAEAEGGEKEDDDGYVPRGAEIGDLVDMLNRFWLIMTPEQRTRAFQEGVEVVGEWIPK